MPDIQENSTNNIKRKNMENIIYNYSLVEENNKKMEKADPRIEVLNSWIDMITNMEKVIDKEQPLSQIKNFLQSMKIKTDKQRQKKEENSH